MVNIVGGVGSVGLVVGLAIVGWNQPGSPEALKVVLANEIAKDINRYAPNLHVKPEDVRVEKIVDTDLGDGRRRVTVCIQRRAFEGAEKLTGIVLHPSGSMEWEFFTECWRVQDVLLPQFPDLKRPRWRFWSCSPTYRREFWDKREQEEVFALKRGPDANFIFDAWIQTQVDGVGGAIPDDPDLLLMIYGARYLRREGQFKEAEALLNAPLPWATTFRDSDWENRRKEERRLVKLGSRE